MSIYVKKLVLLQTIVFKKNLHIWANNYFYSPNFIQKILSFLLVPISIIYTLIILIKKQISYEIDYGIPIINVGNLVLGGSGKTPLTKAIYENYSKKYKTFIILRGYKRESKGMIEVSLDNKILSDVKISGDEAMEYALMGANVIVSENRVKAIKRAKELGCKLIIFDDGFSKFNILKFNILLKPKKEPYSNSTIPSGVYRYPKSFYKFANFIPKKDDILQTSYIVNPSKRMVLVTAIANPDRLKEYFSKCIGKEFFSDHYSFKKCELEDIIKKYNATSLLITKKDYVKIKDFNLPISTIELKTKIGDNFKAALDNYINLQNVDKISKKLKG
ncbi:tetraacyldisaccharide 4'-kinase [Campylobacter blaseri]|nr:tetraacyldisaccharide 4'-kinase [Campylobacter blaseri]